MACSRLMSIDDLCRFRTKQCRRLTRGKCEFGKNRCQYSHNQYWNRRCPFYLSDMSCIRYIPVLCPNVTESCGIIRNSCTRGGECPFAHSSEEVLYHPLYYKINRCKNFIAGKCSVYYCPYVHGLAEEKIPGSYRLPFTYGIDVPPLKGVSLVKKIQLNPDTASKSIASKSTTYSERSSLRQSVDLGSEYLTAPNATFYPPILNSNADESFNVKPRRDSFHEHLTDSRTTEKSVREVSRLLDQYLASSSADQTKLIQAMESMTLLFAKLDGAGCKFQRGRSISKSSVLKAEAPVATSIFPGVVPPSRISRLWLHGSLESIEDSHNPRTWNEYSFQNDNYSFFTPYASWILTAD